MLVSSPSYNLSFTAASLRPELATILAENYLDTGDWSEAKRRVLGTNALQSRSAASGIRMERELRQRLQTLTSPQLALLVSGTAEDRAAIAWLGACKHTPFAFDFVAQVLRDKLALHDPVLRNSDYEAHVEGQAALHPEILLIAESTRKKVRQVLLRMLFEAGLLKPGTALGTVQRPTISPAVFEAVTSDSACWLAAFLVPPADVASA